MHRHHDLRRAVASIAAIAAALATGVGAASAGTVSAHQMTERFDGSFDQTFWYVGGAGSGATFRQGNGHLSATVSANAVAGPPLGQFAAYLSTRCWAEG